MSKAILPLAYVGFFAWVVFILCINSKTTLSPWEMSRALIAIAVPACGLVYLSLRR